MANILKLFSKSPFEPLYEHRLKVHDCINLVRPLFEAVFAGDKEEQDRISREIIEAEKAADGLKMEIRRILPKGIFLPVNREDLLRYLKIQDDLADTVEDIMVLLSIKKLKAPPELKQRILEFVDIAIGVCRICDQATDHLRTLVESGFRGEGVLEVLDLVEEAELAERQADNAGLDIARKLFELEDELKPSDLLLWFRIFGLIGNLADYADKTGDFLRNLLSR